MLRTRVNCAWLPLAKGAQRYKFLSPQQIVRSVCGGTCQRAFFETAVIARAGVRLQLGADLFCWLDEMVAAA